MVNLIQMNEGTIPHPDTGKDVPAHKLVEDYSRPFFRAALARGATPYSLSSAAAATSTAGGHHLPIIPAGLWSIWSDIGAVGTCSSW